MPLRRIVVGVDFSPGSEVATERASELATSHGAELVLVHAGAVAEAPDVPASMQPTVDAYLDVLRDTLASDRARLDALQAKLVAAGVQVSHVVVDRDADDALVETATEIGADLVITGARDLSSARRWLLGSVAEKVVRAAPCSVLCARAGDPDRGFSRIVVGTDYSEGATLALARAVDVAEPGATIDVVHCFQLGLWPGAGVPSTDVVDAYRELRAELTRDAEARGRAAIARFADAKVTFRIALREDNPREALRAVAAEVHADLIVVGSHGRRGLRRWLVGSVAESVISDSPCSVLVAR